MADPVQVHLQRKWRSICNGIAFYPTVCIRPVLRVCAGGWGGQGNYSAGQSVCLCLAIEG